MLIINVSYTRPEYLAVIEAILPYALTAKKAKKSIWEVRDPEVQASWLTRTVARAVASVLFLYKVNRVGECKFTFSETGLLREAKDGQTQLTWSEVKRVFRLPTAFLFTKSSGAMPVPYSSMSAQQRATLELLLSHVGHGVSDAA